MIRFDRIPPAPGEAHIDLLPGQREDLGLSLEALGELATTAIAANLPLGVTSAHDIRLIAEPCAIEYAANRQQRDQVPLLAGMQEAINRIRNTRGSL